MSYVTVEINGPVGVGGKLPDYDRCEVSENACFAYSNILTSYLHAPVLLISRLHASKGQTS